MTDPRRAEGPWSLNVQVRQNQQPVEPSNPLPPQDAPQPQGYWPTYSPASDARPERVPMKYGIGAIVAVVLVAVIGVGVAVWSMTSAPKTPAAAVWTPDPTMRSMRTEAPSPSPSPSTVGNCIGPYARALGWSATVPSGWSCQWVNGREIYIEGPKGDTIEVSAAKVSAASACSMNLLQGTVSVMALPDSTWGGKVSKTANFKDQVWNGQARCASSNTVTYVMLGIAYSGTLTNVVTAEDSLAQSWVWKV